MRSDMRVGLNFNCHCQTIKGQTNKQTNKEEQRRRAIGTNVVCCGNVFPLTKFSLSFCVHTHTHTQTHTHMFSLRRIACNLPLHPFFSHALTHRHTHTHTHTHQKTRNNKCYTFWSTQKTSFYFSCTDIDKRQNEFRKDFSKNSNNLKFSKERLSVKRYSFTIDT